MDHTGKLATVVAMFLAIVVLCGGAGFISYLYGYQKGYSSGHETVRETDYNQGYDRGSEEGYGVGYEIGYESGLTEVDSGYDLRNPTYREMEEFLAQDTTDARTYVKDEYACSDFSADVNNNAESQGIRCAIVNVFYPQGYGHTIIAFETTDRGLIFIEPQFDHEVSLVIGESYSRINNYTPSPRADTVGRFLVMW